MKKTISLVLVLALGLTASVANADFTFGTPTNLGPTVNSTAGEFSPSISANGLELYFTSNRAGGSGAWDLWVTTRATIDDPWVTPVNLGPTVNSSSGDEGLSISDDGLSLFFESPRPGGYGGVDIWVTRRATTDEDWGTPVNLGSTVNSAASEDEPCISHDGLELYFSDYGAPRLGGLGGTDIWVTTRSTTNDPWVKPVNLGLTVNSSYHDGGPSISADGLTLFFASRRPGGYGNADLCVTRRKTRGDPWGTPVNLGPTVNSSIYDEVPSISADGSTLYFISTRPGGVGGDDIWQVSISLVVDFNGDGIVDIKDLLRLIQSWGQDDPMVDIAPPFGDGIVDVLDLELLMSYWGQPVDDPTLIAHWAMDEIEGYIAYDSVGTCDGTLLGDPVWQPEGGMVDGALQLDGIDDYISTPFVLNPADGNFSVFVWIKGGAPGQAVLSQIGRVNWLCADTLEGNLMTELKATGRGATTLLSQTVITDGNWHRVGFVWDGAYRALYVDDILVAEDTQTALASSVGGLKIGCGSGPTAGTFFSGLIDDVRIYNRAVRP